MDMDLWEHKEILGYALAALSGVFEALSYAVIYHKLPNEDIYVINAWMSMEGLTLSALGKTFQL